MKKMLLTTTVILILFSAKSQIAKKNWLLGGSFGYTTRNYSQGTESNSNITPGIAYAVGNNSIVGLKASYSYGKNKDDFGNKNTMQNISTSIFWRKYMLIKNKVGWYAEAGGEISKGTGRSEYPNTNQSNKITNEGYGIAITPGIFYMANPGIILNADFAGIGYNHTTSELNSVKSKSDNFSVNFLNYFSFGIDFIL